MTESTSKSEKITKPIQLLGAWLAGLLSIDSCFLVAAANMKGSSWEASALVLAAIVNVPLFLLAVFLLQTKFRPEMQEDSFYSTYLSHKTNQPITINKDEVRISELSHQLNLIQSQMEVPTQDVKASMDSLASLQIGVNRFLPDRDELVSKLENLGVLGFKSFGGTTAPEERVVAISRFLPKNIKSDVIKAARDLGFRHYSLLDDRLEEIDEQVLFGSYGNAQFEIAGANEKLGLNLSK